MKCTDLLIQDHKIILRSLDVLQQMAACVEEGEQPEREDVETMVRFLRLFADNHHQAKEESGLFPELMRASNIPGPLRHMLFEHDQERSLVQGLQESLYTKKGPEFVHFANHLGDLLRNHIYKEDNILFDIVDRSLSTEQDDKVVAEFAKFQIDPAWLADLRRLEWKYLRKVA